MHKVILGMFMLACVAGCESGEMPLIRSAQAPPNTGPAPRESQIQQVEDILRRAQAVRNTADAAVKLDGTPQAAQTRQSARGCHGPHAACFSAIKTLEHQSKVGTLAGLAGYLIEPLGPSIFSHVEHGGPLPLDLTPLLVAGQDLALAEKSAAQAMVEAQKVADAGAAQQTALNTEMASIEAAGTACAPTGTCESKCNAGDGPSCVVLAVKLWKSTPPRLAEAKVTMQKGCDAGLQRACNGVVQIDGERQQAVAQVDGLWAGVTEVGDDLAQKYRLVSNVSKMAASSPHLQRDVQKMQVINQAIVVERYCPARKAFVQGVSLGEFQKRAVAHCRDQAPTGQGLSGVEVTLTAECQQVYATPCP
jgi:hypothetical protein